MITQKIDPEEEFNNPNINYMILMSKLSNRIITLEADLKVVQDNAVKGYIEKELIDIRKEYFGFLKTDLELQHLVLSNPDIYNKGEENEDI